MRRSRVILTAILLALLGVAAPIAATWYMSSQRAVRDEHERLDRYARLTLQRADATFGQVRRVLRRIEDFGAHGCSPAHIAEMRSMTIGVQAIEEIGYFDRDTLKCTSWGMVEPGVTQRPIDFTTRDGFAITARLRPVVSLYNPMTAVRYGAHNVLIDPSRAVDVVVDPGVQLVLAASNGAVLATLGDPDPKLVASILQRGASGRQREHFYGLARSDGWTAIAIERDTRLPESLRRERMRLLPLGLFFAGLVIALVVSFSRRRLSPLGEMGIAIRKREFVVHYQPIIALAGETCVGAEALVRWRRPDGTLVSPEFFIPLAEASGLMPRITDQVIECVAQDMGDMLARNPTMHVAINLCAEDIRTAGFLPTLEQAIAHHAIRPDQIWMEATERGFVDVKSARDTIEKLRAIGHPVAIDDFGTGYSSLALLQGLPLDALKIDKSFIDTIGTDAATSTVTSHIIAMARTLDLRIVAEGIETRAQADYLADRGVEYGQGWLYSRPLTAEAFAAYCAG